MSQFLVCSLQDVSSPEATVAYYVTDIELLFSTQPFMVAGKAAAVDNSCALVAPNRADRVALESAGTAVVAIPAKLAQRNLLIQVTVDGLSELVPYMPASINCTVREGLVLGCYSRLLTLLVSCSSVRLKGWWK